MGKTSGTPKKPLLVSEQFGQKLTLEQKLQQILDGAPGILTLAEIKELNEEQHKKYLEAVIHRDKPNSIGKEATRNSSSAAAPVPQPDTDHNINIQDITSSPSYKAIRTLGEEITRASGKKGQHNDALLKIRNAFLALPGEQGEFIDLFNPTKIASYIRTKVEIGTNPTSQEIANHTDNYIKEELAKFSKTLTDPERKQLHNIAIQTGKMMSDNDKSSIVESLRKVFASKKPSIINNSYDIHTRDRLYNQIRLIKDPEYQEPQLLTLPKGKLPEVDIQTSSPFKNSHDNLISMSPAHIALEKMCKKLDGSFLATPQSRKARGELKKLLNEEVKGSQLLQEAWNSLEKREHLNQLIEDRVTEIMSTLKGQAQDKLGKMWEGSKRRTGRVSDNPTRDNPQSSTGLGR